MAEPKTILDVVGENIVNPKCPECGRSTERGGIFSGPKLCQFCAPVLEAEFQAQVADYTSQERPRGRSIHVVRLPEGMVKK